MIDSLSTAVRGMQDQEARVNASARRLAGAGITTKTPDPGRNPSSPVSNPGGVEPADSVGFLPDVDIAQEMVNIKIAEKMYEANAKVVETTAKMLDKTIDLTG